MNGTLIKHWAILLAAGLSLAGGGCAHVERYQPFEPPKSKTRIQLEELPVPAQKVLAAVYTMPDETGQHKETTSGTPHYSKAVTQGATALLIEALQKAGGGEWFRVLERARLGNVINERRIITDERRNAVDAAGNPTMPPLMPLLYAGVLLEGGIIGYDTNVLTGGAGARYLGVGASTQYREDLVTVNLRAVSSQTGEIWKNVIVSKRVYSTQVRGDVFRFVSSNDILEIEGGYTRNEPRLLAAQQAIEEAVYILIMEGTKQNLWSFKDPNTGKQAMEAYYAIRNASKNFKPNDRKYQN